MSRSVHDLQCADLAFDQGLDLRQGRVGAFDFGHDAAQGGLQFFRRDIGKVVAVMPRIAVCALGRDHLARGGHGGMRPGERPTRAAHIDS